MSDVTFSGMKIGNEIWKLWNALKIYKIQNYIFKRLKNISNLKRWIKYMSFNGNL